MKTRLILICMMVPLFAKAEPKSKVVGEIGMIEGMVILDSSRVGNGAKVREGSVIEVKEDSRATLILGKGTVFHLAAGSKMVVNEFGVVSETEEKADLDLKFGRTRALILNQGGKREIKIRSRAVTMGVRGTEIFIDAPRESSRPLRYFTIEGSADLRLSENAPPIALNQNQGVSTKGEPASAPQSEPVKPADLKGAIKDASISPPVSPAASPARPLPPGGGKGAFGQLSDQYGVGALSPVSLDPVMDRDRRIKLNVQFCNATTGNCN
ncbi:MAG: hypothetical protein EBX52_08805 [Proteobacteria bacterium]|nr:hypothetical protein [Pseudomonadota bacterium]